MGEYIPQIVGAAPPVTPVSGMFPQLPGIASSYIDNAPAIIAAMSAATPGTVITFTPPPAGMVYWISGNIPVPSGVAVWGGGWVDTLPMFKVIPTATPHAIFAGANWLNNVATGDHGCIFHDLSIDLNQVNAHGIAFTGKANFVFHNYIKSWGGAFAAVFTDGATQNLTNNGLAQENQIIWNKLDGTASGNINGHHCIWVKHSTASVVTDSDIGFNITTGSGDTNIQLDAGGDWWIYRNHFYFNYQGSVINIVNQSGDHIIDNQSDRFGVTGAAATNYYGIQLSGNPGAAPAMVEGNVFGNPETGSGNYIYLSYTTNVGGGSTVQLIVKGNTWRQAAATGGTSTCYSFNNTGAGTLLVTLDDPPPIGTTMATTPVIVAGIVAIAKAITNNTTVSASVNPTSGTAFTPNANVDTAGTVPINGGTSGTYTVTYGPTTGAEHSVITAGGAPTGISLVVPLPHIPAGWKVVVTVAGSAAIGTAQFLTK